MQFSHAGNAGDIIYSLPTMLGILQEKWESKGTLVLKINEIANYGPMIKHPNGNVKLTPKIAEMLVPLLESQRYIDKVIITDKETDSIQLDRFRSLSTINQMQGNIARWPMYPHGVSWDLSKAWLKVIYNDTYRKDIIINRTNRYHGLINYDVLKDVKDVKFIGLETEFNEMKNRLPNLEHLKLDNFLDIATAIYSCKVFIGNQSVAFSIAEALKCHRILEVCHWTPNVIPEGPNATDVYYQPHFNKVVKSYL